MISNAPLTEEMVENTKSFFQYCLEENERRLFEKRNDFFTWFYDPSFISQKQEYTDCLTENELNYIEREVTTAFMESFGHDSYFSWYEDKVIVDWDSKPKNGAILVEEEQST